MSSSFSSKSNQELVIKWKQDHRAITASAGTIIKAYETNEVTTLKKEIESLNHLTVEHLMAEDMAFYQFSMLEDDLDEELKTLIEDFIETFEETKIALMDFLTKYTLPDAVYNQEFIDNFTTIVGVLAERIAYEEKTLYKTLQEK